MAGDELKRHEPSARRLAKLRQAGQWPWSRAVAVVVGLAGLSAVLPTAGGLVVPALARLMARDLQHAGERNLDPQWGVNALAGHLAWAAGLMVMIGGAAALLSIVAHWLQAGERLGERAAGESPLPGGPTLAPWSPGRVPVWAPVTAGLVGAGWLGLCLLRRLEAADDWGQLTMAGGWWGLWWRWLALLSGIALLHRLMVQVSFGRHAAMSDREWRAEQRETGGATGRSSVRDRGGQGG